MTLLLLEISPGADESEQGMALDENTGPHLESEDPSQGDKVSASPLD